MYKQGEERHFKGGYTEKKGPFKIKLLSGVYDILVQDYKLPSQPEVWLRGVEIVAGESVEKTAEFALEGTLEVTALKEGKPFHSYVRLYKQGEERHFKGGYTEKKGPFKIKLLSGVYDILVQDYKLPSQPEVWLRGVEIVAGESVEKTAEFALEGTLEVTALKEGKPFHSYLRLYKQGEERHFKGGYTEKDGPFKIKLLSGMYDIQVQDFELPSQPEVWLRGVEVIGGETTKKTTDFVKEGILEVMALKEGKPFHSYLRLYRQGEERHFKGGYTKKDGPFKIRLLPGTYDILVQAHELPGKPELWLRGVKVESGRKVNASAEFSE